MQKMANDANPVGYTYQEAAGILSSLGFTLASRSAGSHRKWAFKRNDRATVIGLVDSGKGKLKAYLIRDMIRQLRENGFIK